MNDLNNMRDYDMPNIAQLSTNSHIIKVINNELSHIFKNISTDYNIDYDNLTQKYYPEMSKFNISETKKRTRRKLPDDMRCMGRKLDYEQCTRSRQDNNEFCQTHQKNLPNGRVDDNNNHKKEKGKRGRKPKIEYDSIPTRVEYIDGENYLVDSDRNVYTYDLDNPEWIGKKNDFGNIDYFVLKTL